MRFVAMRDGVKVRPKMDKSRQTESRCLQVPVSGYSPSFEHVLTDIALHQDLTRVVTLELRGM